MLPPHLRQLLGTNFALDASQISEIRNAQQETSRLRLDTLRMRDDIAPLSSPTQLEEIDARTALLDADLKDYMILLSSPICRIPDEVLSEIFLHVPLSLANSKERNRQVTKLTRVSTSWRSVAFNTPWLWTSLYLVLPSESASFEAFIPFQKNLKQWFGRTGSSLPLALRINVQPSKGSKAVQNTRVERPNGCLRLIVTLIKPYASRLHHLDLDSWFIYSLILPFLSQSDGYQNVMSLVLRATDEDQYPISQNDSPDPNRLFPSLTRVKFERDMFTVTPAFFPLPWNQLTHLTVNYILVDYCLNLLTMCPLLEFGDFNFRDGRYGLEDMENSDRLISLHNLKELTLTFMRSFDPYILHRLDVPILYTLRIGAMITEHEDSWGWWRQDLATDDVLTPLQNVRRLSLIKEWPISLPLFNTILQHTPHLIDLELELDGDLGPFLWAMTGTTDEPAGPCTCSPNLIPRMESIRVDMVNYYEFNPEKSLAGFPLQAMLKFLKARKECNTLDDFGMLGPSAFRRCSLFVSDWKASKEKVERKRIFDELSKLDDEDCTIALGVRHRLNHKGWRSAVYDAHTSVEAVSGRQ